MNQRYLLLSSLLVAGTCLAQSNRDLPYKMQHLVSVEQPIPVEPDAARDGGDIIFNENFANGLAGNNGFGPWTTSGPNGNIWKRSTTGPVGSYSVPTQIMAQPAPANGFMAFWSDSANCNCTSGTANWPATPTEWDGSLESPVLDLSATPAVAIEFRQRLRWCCQATSPHALEVSTDGGVTWPISLPTATGISTNNDPGTQTRSIVLTAAISADPSQVKFRFHHNPTAAAYHWQIDDVKLIELFANDMKLNDAYMSHTGTGEEYGRIPPSQLNPTMLVGGTVINVGAIEQTNVNVAMDVVGPVPFNAILSAGNVPAGDTTQAEQDFNLPALTAGLYEGSFTVSADATDQIPTNNAYLRNFEISDTRYSVDGIGNHPTGYQTLAAIGTNSFANADDGLILMNYYELINPLTVYGLELELSGGTVAGGFVIVSLRDTANVFATVPDLSTVIAESDPYDITQLDVDAGTIQVCFPSPAELGPSGIFASVTLYSNAGAAEIGIIDDVTVPQPGITSAIYVPNEQVFSNGNGYAIRLVTASNIVCGTSTRDNEQKEEVTLYPNPSNGRVNVSIPQGGSYGIEVIDLLGQPVFTTRTNGNTTLDLSSQAEGVYMVRITGENGSTLQRLTLTR